jgi:predicted transcriptional regulator
MAMTAAAVKLKSPRDMKTRINPRAAAKGKSPYAFMIDALAAQTSREEIRGAFVASALDARQELARNGRVMAAVDVHKWLLARAGGGKATRPRARKLVTSRAVQSR